MTESLNASFCQNSDHSFYDSAPEVANNNNINKEKNILQQQQFIFYEISQIKNIFMSREIDIFLMQESFLTFLELSANSTSQNSSQAQKILYFLKNADINVKERNDSEQMVLRKMCKIQSQSQENQQNNKNKEGGGFVHIKQSLNKLASDLISILSCFNKKTSKLKTQIQQKNNNSNEDQIQQQFSQKTFKDNLYSILQQQPVSINKYMSYIVKFSKSKFELEFEWFKKQAIPQIQSQIDVELTNKNFKQFQNFLQNYEKTVNLMKKQFQQKQNKQKQLNFMNCCQQQNNSNNSFCNNNNENNQQNSNNANTVQFLACYDIMQGQFNSKISQQSKSFGLFQELLFQKLMNKNRKIQLKLKNFYNNYAIFVNKKTVHKDIRKKMRKNMSLLLKEDNEHINIDNILDCEHSLQKEKFKSFAKKFQNNIDSYLSENYNNNSSNYNTSRKNSISQQQQQSYYQASSANPHIRSQSNINNSTTRNRSNSKNSINFRIKNNNSLYNSILKKNQQQSGMNIQSYQQQYQESQDVAKDERNDDQQVNKSKKRHMTEYISTDANNNSFTENKEQVEVADPQQSSQQAHLLRVRKDSSHSNNNNNNNFQTSNNPAIQKNGSIINNNIYQHNGRVLEKTTLRRNFFQSQPKFATPAVVGLMNEEFEQNSSSFINYTEKNSPPNNNNTNNNNNNKIIAASTKLPSLTNFKNSPRIQSSTQINNNNVQIGQQQNYNSNIQNATVYQSFNLKSQQNQQQNLINYNSFNKKVENIQQLSTSANPTLLNLNSNKKTTLDNLVNIIYQQNTKLCGGSQGNNCPVEIEEPFCCQQKLQAYTQKIHKHSEDLREMTALTSRLLNNATINDKLQNQMKPGQKRKASLFYAADENKILSDLNFLNKQKLSKLAQLSKNKLDFTNVSKDIFSSNPSSTNLMGKKSLKFNLLYSQQNDSDKIMNGNSNIFKLQQQDVFIQNKFDLVF